ncbi:MAG: HU family DNA-binding protein [Hyphomicrobium sp.]
MAVKPASKSKPASKPASKSKPAAKVETITLRQLGAALAEAHDMPKKQGIAILEDMVTMITKHLKKGAKIRITGLGILQVRKRPARMGRNPATGETIKIKASKKVAFRAAKDLKEAV